VKHGSFVAVYYNTIARLDYKEAKFSNATGNVNRELVLRIQAGACRELFAHVHRNVGDKHATGAFPALEMVAK